MLGLSVADFLVGSVVEVVFWLVGKNNLSLKS